VSDAVSDPESEDLTRFGLRRFELLELVAQPRARRAPGATLQAIWFIGQFHGVISAQGPMGSLTISVVPWRSSKG
jgi:hypothetical protein